MTRATLSKRADILLTATNQFSRRGFEDTKWTDITTELGIGPTAPYYYFESKLHCLYEIMSDTLVFFRSMFDEVTAAHTDFRDGFAALMHAYFELTDHEVASTRVLVIEQGRLSQTRPAEREEAARRAARSAVRELERAWSHYLSGGMSTGAIPAADPRLLARAVLGIYNSVWEWYSPHGTLDLDAVSAFYSPLLSGLVGLRSI